MAKCDSIDLYQEVAEDAYRFGIGKTPLYYHEVGNSVIYAKMEYRNKYGSIKDRAGFFMISSGIKKGLLDRNKTIIEASSGNTGIALANIAKEMGYRAKIYVPNASSEATKDAIRITGQEMVEVFDEASKHGSINIDTAVSMLKKEMEMKPGTKSIASPILLLPLPLGPVITVKPSLKRIVLLLPNDLKLSSSTDSINMLHLSDKRRLT